jgi:hypothetical protein
MQVKYDGGVQVTMLKYPLCVRDVGALYQSVMIEVEVECEYYRRL